jgi:hypothetical protein
MHLSTILPLLLAPLLAVASPDWSGAPGGPPGGAPTGGWGGDESWQSTETTTTYVAETTITMTLLAVQTETQHYFSQNTTSTYKASSTYKLPSSSSVAVFSTPAAPTPPAVATGAADLLNVNAVAMVMGLGAAVVGAL